MCISCDVAEDGKVVMTESNHEEVILVVQDWQWFKDEHKIEGGWDTLAADLENMHFRSVLHL